MNHQGRILPGMRVLAGELRSIEGILTRADYLTNRRLHVVGTVTTFPAGHSGSLWKVEHDDGSVAVYFPSELAEEGKLEEWKQLRQQKSDETGSELSVEFPEVAEITEADADLLITTVSLINGAKSGAEDALERLTGNHFFDQIPAEGLGHLQAAHACGDPDLELGCNDVLFIGDDASGGIGDVVQAALNAADELGVTTVALPLVAFTPDAIVDFNTAFAIMTQVKAAVAAFDGSGPEHVKRILIVMPPSINNGASADFAKPASAEAESSAPN